MDPAGVPPRTSAPQTQPRTIREDADGPALDGAGAIFVLRRAPDGKYSIPFACPTTESFHGISLRSLQLDPKGLLQLIEPADLVCLQNTVEASAAALSAWSCEFRIRTPQCAERRVQAWSMPVREADGGIAWHGFVNDITERRRTELQLARSRELLKVCIEHAPLGIAMFDRDMRYICASRTWQAAVGASEGDLVGKLHYDDQSTIPAEWVDAHRRGLAGEVVTGEGEWSSSEGRRVHSRWEIHPWGDQGGETGGIIVLFEDVTDARAMEAELRHAHKMEALGQLAGGVAHDFNNLLQIILGYAELLQDEHSENDSASRFTSEILGAARGASSLTRQLLAFGRRQVLTTAVIDLNDVVRGTSKMLKRLLSEAIDYQLELEQPLWLVETDADQLAQVLINLCVNARDAMPDGGTLKITTNNLRVPTAEGARHPKLPPGEYVMLTVYDTGTGMEPGVLEHIFEPFFTTKEAGKGTGLGLSTVYGIIRQSEGHVWAESKPNCGTRIMVCLPRTSHAPGQNPKLTRHHEPPVEKMTILLVEDDPDVRSAVKEYLPSLGYRVLAAHPDEALSLAERHASEIDLLLTDVVMPSLSGPALADKVRVMCPCMKTVFMSGYIDDAVTRHGVLDSGAPFLQKPFSLTELAAAIRKASSAG